MDDNTRYIKAGECELKQTILLNRLEGFGKTLNQVSTDIKESHKILNNKIDSVNSALSGDLTRPGIYRELLSHKEWIEEQKSTKTGLMNTVYKTVIFILLSAIAIRLGLK